MTRKQLWWAGLAFVAIALAASVIVYLTRSPSSEAQAEITSSPNPILAKGEVFYNANCASCHGVDGSGYGNNLRAPALNGSEHSWHHSDTQIIGLLRQGGIQMPAVAAEWTDEEVEAVISFVKQWWSPQQRRSQQGEIGEF